MLAKSFGPSSWAARVESLQENEICEQLGRTRFPESSAAMPAAPGLKAGGALDALLLEPGASHRLLQRLSDVFQADPPPSNQGCGTQHSFKGGAYPRKVFSPEAVIRMLGLARSFWVAAPNITRLVVGERSRLVICGDTHGQLEDVLWMFFKYGVPSSSNQYLFNGDIVDRGGHALEILMLLFALKRDEPSCVHILRGNHEDEATCTSFGFKSEIESKFGQGGAGGWIFQMFTNQVFPVLPLCALISDASSSFFMCVLHGGIPVNGPGQQGPVTLDGDIAKLNRTSVSVQRDRSKATLTEHIMFNMLWADPARAEGNAGHKGRGNAFSEKDTLAFCRANRVSCLVRAHQPPENLRGTERCHDGRCITVFSASNYCGCLGNKGGVLMCDGKAFAGQGPQAYEHMAPSWPQLASIFAAHSIVDAPHSVRMSVATQTESGRPFKPEPKPKQDPALGQVEQYVAEQIVRFKQRLYWELTCLDKLSTGCISRNLWTSTMSSMMPDVPHPVWKELIQEWKLPEEVPYVHLLHRFQVSSELGASRCATHVDVFSAMAQLRVTISDVEADELLRSLDKDLSGEVDLVEFQGFLRQWRIQVPEWQTAALFEALLMGLDGKRPLVEDVLLCLALVSRSPASSPCGAAWMETARSVGEQIERSGCSLVSFFRRWDVDHSGFLSASELGHALSEGLPSLGMNFSPDQLKTLVIHMDSQGVQNDRISLIEFLRAVGSRSLGRELSGALLGEVLKPVFFYRSVLENIFQTYDPGHSNMVSVDEFRRGLSEINRQLVADGGTTLTDSQAVAVCGIASGGARQVQYREFLKSLKVVDTVKRANMVRVAQDGLRAALGSYTI